MSARTKPHGRAIAWRDGSIMIDTIVWGDHFFDSEFTEKDMMRKAFQIVHNVALNEKDPIHAKAWKEFLGSGYKLVEFDVVPRQSDGGEGK